MITYLFRKLKHLVTENFLKNIYYGLFHSHINYGILLWGHASGVQEILLHQKRVLRIITRSGPREPCKPIFTRLGIPTVYSQYVINSLTYIQEHIDDFPVRAVTHSHNTRNATQLDPPRCRLAKSKNSFPCRAIYLYNQLPQSVQSESAKKFKEVLRTKLTEYPLYSLTDFSSVVW